MDDDAHAALLAQGWRPRALPGLIGLVGPLYTRQEAAGWAYALLPTAAHLNPAGVVHGGLLTTLADHALSAIAWQASGRVPCVTVQLDTHFLAAAQAGRLLEARGRVVRITGSLVFMQGAITVAGDEVLLASAVMKKLGRPAAAPAGLNPAAAPDPSPPSTAP